MTINGEKLKIVKGGKSKYDQYFYKGILYGENPTNRTVTKHAILTDGQVIAIVKYDIHPAWLPIIIIIACSLISVAFGIVQLLKHNANSSTEKVETTIDLGDTEITKNSLTSEKPIVLKYRKYVTYVNGSIELGIVNGNEKASIYIKGDGVSSEKVSLNKNEEKYYFDIDLTSKETLIPATLVFKLDKETKEREYNIVIENSTQQSVDTDSDTTFQYEEVITD